MNNAVVPPLSRWLNHVRVLAQEIGPRGSTTEAERQGSEYCQRVLIDLGIQPQIETFQSARSIYQPHLLAMMIILAAFAIYPWAGRTTAVIATLLTVVAIVSQLLELSFRDNLLRRLVPKGSSQNVVATIPAAGEWGKDLVLIGHVDSHRTPLIFKSASWITAFKTFISISFFLILAQAILFFLGTIFQWAWIWPATFPTAVVAVLWIINSFQADSTPFSAGANDNATGAGLVLTLAEEFQFKPLQNTRIWLVCTGCEEVQHYGAADFFKRHQDDLRQPSVVVFESLGCAGPAWLTKEGILVPFKADSNLVTLAEKVAQDNPTLGAYPAEVSGGNTEMADALLAGWPAITIGGIGPNGELPYWHQVGDTFDKMDPEVMDRAYAFVWSYIQELDQQD